MIKTALTAITILFSTQALSETPYYSGIGYQYGVFEADADKLNPGSLILKAGKYLIPNVAIEAHLSIGLNKDKKEKTTLGEDHTQEIKVKNGFSLLAKGDLSISNNTRVYGLLGISQIKFEGASIASLNSITFDSAGLVLGNIYESKTGLSFGAGMEIEIRNHLSLSGEYISYLRDDSYDFSGFHLGIIQRF